MTRIFKALATGFLLLGLAPAALAADWNVDREQSKIEFEYLRAGEPTKGIFAKFSGYGTFDPANPSAARMSLSIDTTSIDLYDTMASAFATSAEWFDSKNHPRVEYQLTGLEPLGDDVYRATGTLSLRGESKPITADINLVVDPASAKAKGRLEVVRADYLLGVGPSAAFVEIGPNVIVSFDLLARPLK
ncbi:MAG: YceI family protein [Pseudomonadota bacterium]